MKTLADELFRIGRVTLPASGPQDPYTRSLDDMDECHNQWLFASQMIIYFIFLLTCDLGVILSPSSGAVRQQSKPNHATIGVRFVKTQTGLKMTSRESTQPWSWPLPCSNI